MGMATPAVALRSVAPFRKQRSTPRVPRYLECGARVRDMWGAVHGAWGSVSSILKRDTLNTTAKYHQVSPAFAGVSICPTHLNEMGCRWDGGTGR